MMMAKTVVTTVLQKNLKGRGVVVQVRVVAQTINREMILVGARMMLLQAHGHAEMALPPVAEII
jgi:hypothetical protein